MTKIRKQRSIVDRQALGAALQEIAEWSGYTDKTRGQILDLFKEAHRRGEDEIRRRFETAEESGLSAARTRTFLIDQLVRVIYDFANDYVYPAPNPTAAEQISICATGGYGRALMAPHSDIDLLFLLPYKVTAQIEQSVEFVLYTLWDLGLKVGHATRSVDECLKIAMKDHTIRTALLDTRWVWGDQILYQKFQTRYAAEIVNVTGPAYVEEKLAERNERHERMGDTRYVLEPNVKDGKGGQRDLQTMYWITKYLYGIESPGALVERGIFTKEDARRFQRSERFLWTVRFHLHYLAGRPEERITFDVQNEIAARMGYADRAGAKGVERFMKYYFLIAKNVGDLTRIVCAELEERHKKKRPRLGLAWLTSRRRKVPGFKLIKDRLAFESDGVTRDDPLKILQLFQMAQRYDLDIHPVALREVTRNINKIDATLRKDPEANRIFMDILTSQADPEQGLRALNEAGVLGRFVRDFGRIVAQMQYDMYHVYTVDEHTIRAIGILYRVEQGVYEEEMPISTRIVHEVDSRRALYAAVFLHDIAKGRGGDHSELGAKVAKKLCPRLGLSAAETETAAWLVRQHLLMSKIAFKRDLSNAKTISDFVDAVQSPERLRLLLVLTAVDIRAVGPDVWNGWKAGLLRELFNKAMERMSGTFVVEMREVRVEKAKEALRESLTNWSVDEIETHINQGYPEYWLNFDTAAHSRHAELVLEADSRDLDVHIQTRADPDHDVTELTVYTRDHPGLFALICGALSLAGASIVGAKIATLASGMALDTFMVQDAKGRQFDMNQPRRLDRLVARIHQALEGTLNVDRELDAARVKALSSRTRVFAVPPRVLIDNKASRTHTVIEVNGRDRLGFLHDVTRACTVVGLQINSATIATWGERIVDVFYVKDVFGLKVESEAKLAAIREGLLAAATGPVKTPDAKKKSA